MLDEMEKRFNERLGRYQAAIDQFEAHADRAPSHPDASFNRGFAYLMRIRNGAEKPGDLGRAAAAFGAG
mgnify:CR=1 FL=1